MSLVLTLYRLGTGLLEPTAPALLRRRAARGKEDPARLTERLGRASLPRPDGRLVWLHGASVGETLSLLPLIEALREAKPSTSILVTSSTVASAELLAKRLPGGVLHQFAPVDAPRAVKRFLDHWAPDLAVLVESELWPNLIMAAKGRRMTLALVSARLSRSSLDGWGRAPVAARELLSAFSLVMSQDDATADGLTRLGARDDGRLNLKLAASPLPVDEARLAKVLDTARGRPILLAASTHPGEEEIALDALARLPDRPILIIAPRHPARGEAVASLAAARGLAVTREGGGQPLTGKEDAHVADALGELGLWMRAARGVLLGGSLIPGPEGHNPLEPARLEAPFLSGPHVANWAAVYAHLAGAFIPVRTEEDVAEAFQRILDDRNAAAAMAGRAHAIALSDGDTLGEAVAKLAALIP